MTQISLAGLELYVEWHLRQEEGMSPEEVVEDSKVFGQSHSLMGTRGMKPFSFHVLQVDLH